MKKNYEFDKNPFESGHIKNYMMLYVSVVVIMVLFFIAANLFHEPQEFEKKIFTKEKKPDKPVIYEKEETEPKEEKKSGFFKDIKVMPNKAY